MLEALYILRKIMKDKQRQAKNYLEVRRALEDFGHVICHRTRVWVLLSQSFLHLLQMVLWLIRIGLRLLHLYSKHINLLHQLLALSLFMDPLDKQIQLINSNPCIHHISHYWPPRREHLSWWSVRFASLVVEICHEELRGEIALLGTCYSTFLKSISFGSQGLVCNDSKV